MDPGLSLFNPGQGIDVNTEDHGQEEYEDDLQEQKRQEKELQVLLHTEFDDLIDDDESNVSTNISEDGQQTALEKLWPNSKSNETSTPKTNNLPQWSVNYTPISGHTQSSKYQPLANKILGNDRRILEHVSEEGSTASPTKSALFNGVQDGAVHFHNTAVPNGDVPDNNQHNLNGKLSDDVDYSHQRYAQDLVNMKNTMIKQQEEYEQEVRLLKHQLILAKGEKESLTFSLQQARQLLTEKEHQVYDYQKNINQLEKDLRKERDNYKDLMTQLDISRSAIDSLKQQVSELTQYDTYTYLKAKNENILKMSEIQHKQEISQWQYDIKEKDALIKRLKAQVDELEKYQEQTLPEKLKGINHLTRTLESVESYCQRLLNTDALKEDGFLTLEHNERQLKENEDQNIIATLLNAISDLGAKLQDGQNQVPIDTHTSVLKEVEREKYELEAKFKIVSQEVTMIDNEKKELTEKNKKLSAMMETMIKKHDLDIKSAIEKYHSLHSKETKLLQSELNEASMEEKNRLREFYEEKLALVYEELDIQKTRLNEAQELYVKVCQEKNQIESLSNSDSINKNSLIQEQLHKAYNQIEIDLRQQFQKEYENRLKLVEEDWSKKKAQDMTSAVKECQSALSTNEDKLEKELESAKHQLSSVQTNLKETESKFQNSEEKIKKMENLAEEYRAKIVHLEASMADQQKHFENTQKLFATQLTEQQKDFNGRLNYIEQAQRNEIDSIMAEVQKAMEEEKASIISKGNEVIKRLQEELQKLKWQLQTRNTMTKLVDFSCLVTIPTEKERILFEELTKATNYIQHLEKQSNNIQLTSKHSVESQTTTKMVDKQHVIELNNLYKELVLELKAEVQRYHAGRSENAANKLYNSILEYHKKFKALNSS